MIFFESKNWITCAFDYKEPSPFADFEVLSIFYFHNNKFLRSFTLRKSREAIPWLNQLRGHFKNNFRHSNEEQKSFGNVFQIAFEVKFVFYKWKKFCSIEPTPGSVKAILFSAEVSRFLSFFLFRKLLDFIRLNRINIFQIIDFKWLEKQKTKIRDTCYQRCLNFQRLGIFIKNKNIN